MKRSASIALILFAFDILGLGLDKGQSAQAEETSRAAKSFTEDYSHVPMPPGFKVVATELEGPVFADSRGMTLYAWPLAALRGGYAGDPKDRSTCESKVITKSSALESPYPPGLDLPDAGKRQSCAAMWPPAPASVDAKPVGKWTIITRSDGTRQWAYGNHALYTSSLDQAPGDVLGGTAMRRRVRNEMNAPSTRSPVGPPPAVPPGFKVRTTSRGRLLLTDKEYAVYTSDNDGLNKSNCFDACARRWPPLLAAESDQPVGEWSIVGRAPGLRQWAFRKKPVYTFSQDMAAGVIDGGDEPGWHNVYTQLAPQPPKGFTIQTSLNGDVLADSHGKSIYIYACIEDSVDQLSCDTLDAPQVYRLAICGNGDTARCQRLWRYVSASPNAKSDSRIWSIVWVDPATGRRAQPGQTGALNVWAYRGRPVYTYAGDKEPGDIEGNGLGEWQGWWNGFRVFWIRDQFFDGG